MNFLGLQLGNYEVQLVANMEVGNQCVTNVKFFDRRVGPKESGGQHETKVCPQLVQYSDMTAFQSMGVVVNSPDIKVQILPLITKNKWSLFVQVPGNDIEIAATFFAQESFSWAMPLSSDNRKYYLTHRNMAVKLEGHYIMHGDKFDCNNDCLMGEDSFRAHMSYPTNYWQAWVQTVLDDGRTFGVMLGDGIGSHMTTKSSSEDFASLDGKIHKLGVGVLKESDPNNLDIMSPKNLSTLGGEVVGDSRCSLDYTPVH